MYVRGLDQGNKCNSPMDSEQLRPPSSRPTCIQQPQCGGFDSSRLQPQQQPMSQPHERLLQQHKESQPSPLGLGGKAASSHDPQPRRHQPYNSQPPKAHLASDCVSFAANLPEPTSFQPRNHLSHHSIAPAPSRIHHDHLATSEMEWLPSPAAPEPGTAEKATLLKEKKRLLEQLEEIRERRRCVVCLDKDFGSVFMPCGHLVACSTCATILAACPICRTPVHYFQNVKLD